MNINIARSLHDPAARVARRALLEEPHVRPLTAYVEQLRASSPDEFPDFDPLDGGVEARMLFLLEKPGPMTSASRTGGAGSGFISRDNDDPTAEAIFDFMRKAGIPRRETVFWNMIAGWNGTRKVTAREVREGALETLRLVRLLPRLRAVVLVGKRAERAYPLLAAEAFSLSSSVHPSPLVRASQETSWRRIPEDWRAAYRALANL
ncbi:MAG: uracil-DNA glycosylase [Phenylobacterium sp.]|jgi:hypothetical protein|nr:uracil-DNA glycosylase [Phenylobacterium sp.]